MSPTLILTHAQREALSRMPDGWFFPCDLRMRNAAAMCKRLRDKGVLSARSARPEGADILRWVAQTPVYRHHEYRKLGNAGPGEAVQGL